MARVRLVDGLRGGGGVTVEASRQQECQLFAGTVR